MSWTFSTCSFKPALPDLTQACLAPKRQAVHNYLSPHLVFYNGDHHHTTCVSPNPSYCINTLRSLCYLIALSCTYCTVEVYCANINQLCKKMCPPFEYETTTYRQRWFHSTFLRWLVLKRHVTVSEESDLNRLNLWEVQTGFVWLRIFSINLAQ